MQSTNFNLVGVKIYFDDTVLIVIVLYIPPTLSIDDYDDLFNSLLCIKEIWTYKTIILGDFNIPSYKLSCENNIFLNNKIILLNLFSQALELRQVNSIPNSLNRLLDLVFVNFKVNIEKCLDPIFPEDKYHPSLIICSEFVTEKKITNCPMHESSLR